MVKFICIVVFRFQSGQSEDCAGRVYESLEEIHVLALAHVLRRPIIVVADLTLKVSVAAWCCDVAPCCVLCAMVLQPPRTSLHYCLASHLC